MPHWTEIWADNWRKIREEREMPSKSPKQARLMAAAAHDPKFAKKAGVPPKVAKEFNRADAGKGTIKRKTGKRGK